MIYALIVGIEKMNIVRMLLVVITISAVVWDLKQHSCNMVRDRRFKIRRFVLVTLSNLKKKRYALFSCISMCSISDLCFMRTNDDSWLL